MQRLRGGPGEPMCTLVRDASGAPLPRLPSGWSGLPLELRDVQRRLRHA